MQGYAGWMSLTGEPSAPPQKSGLSLVDLSAGVMASLVARRKAESHRPADLHDVASLDERFGLARVRFAWPGDAPYGGDCSELVR